MFADRPVGFGSKCTIVLRGVLSRPVYSNAASLGPISRLVAMPRCARFEPRTSNRSAKSLSNLSVRLKLAGASPWYVTVRHLLPNVRNTFIVLLTLDIGLVIFMEAALSFLGLGVQPPDPSWGGMIAEGRSYLETAWWGSVLPGLVLMLTVLCTNLIGEAFQNGGGAGADDGR